MLHWADQHCPQPLSAQINFTTANMSSITAYPSNTSSGYGYSRAYWQNILFALFTLSGFSGLIYESVWSNYLKLFLGHAAYAQTLVLAMFMGGMAAGAWLSGRYLARIPHPLLGYAAVELVIGLFGLLFHKIFVGSTGFMLDSVLPGIESPFAAESVRWIFAAILILPQTILLGATFPLISIGILRAFPHMPGGAISMLYFTNSIGAVIGVLTSGFYLINKVGLPGTILAAALLNFILAISVYGIHKQLVYSPPKQEQFSAGNKPLLLPLLMVALITGLSSFIYEISWIRMLSMILGASTHSFELMLSAFILGLALGGLWLKKRIDKFPKPLHALAIIQLLMGAAAAATAIWYNSCFEFMSWFLQSIITNEGGYLLYTLFSHLLAALIMLPVTFLAGMTLPLITCVLYKQGAGESAISKVYAFNTLGAILGVTLAAFILLPLTGLKASVLIGAGLDLLLAIYLFFKGGSTWRWRLLAPVLSVLIICGTALAEPFNNMLMSSGVFRRGELIEKKDFKSVLHIDGRTATVDVFDLVGKVRVIATNGKADASVAVHPSHPPTKDEDTMTMLGGLPLLVKPQAQTAAVIGMGAGMSANILLASQELKALDVIEIEAAMVDGARLFGSFSDKVFSDPRSKIHIDDAKSYFSAHKKKYDLIISEPSDSWVSGVSSLFTDEFYQRIRYHLNQDGILVQWLHLYEVSPESVASIFNALGKNFSDYRIYVSNVGNMVILAKTEGQIPDLDPRGLENPVLRAHFARVGVLTVDDVRFQEIGNKASLAPYFASIGAPANSDFFPFVDQNAAKARFMKQSSKVTYLGNVGVPIPGPNYHGKIKPSAGKMVLPLDARINAQYAPVLLNYLGNQAQGPIPKLPQQLHQLLLTLKSPPDCSDPVAESLWMGAGVVLASATIPFSTAEEFAPSLNYLNRNVCPTATASRNLLQLFAAVAQRDAVSIEKAASIVLSSDRNPSHRTYATNAILLSYFEQKKWGEIQAMAKIANKSVLFEIVSGHAAFHLHHSQTGRQ